MLKLWREDGLTVVFVTHSVYESAFLSTRLIVMTPRPGRVAGEIRVTAPQVRTQEWRATPEFAAIAREVSLTLRHAMDVGADIGSRI
jgi:NitT/TauT family transport system ATP-binding protein